MIPRVLVIAGSDSGGGAGIQADIKTAMALGAYACTALTALTAQDTHGVHAIHPVPPGFIRQQIAVALADPGADAIKTGMLGDAAVIEAVAGALAETRLPMVVDPVMVAKGGAVLLETAALSALKRVLLPLATLLTPNLPEAELLTGLRIATLAEMHHAAETLLTLGVPAVLLKGGHAVLLKGGHAAGDTVTDLLATETGTAEFTRPRLPTRHTHGTGCTLASALSCQLALGHDVPEAMAAAKRYITGAVQAGFPLGSGIGPTDHLWQLRGALAAIQAEGA